MGKKLTTEEFIEKARIIHGDKYDYSLVVYAKNNEKIKIVCNEHGVFEQTPNGHLSGNGCIVCGRLDMISKLKLSDGDFIEKARAVHGNKYDYSLVNYEKNNEKVKIICPTHGEFWQSPSGHLNGKQCLKCSRLSGSSLRKLTIDEFIKKSNILHSNKYSYDKFIYVNSKKNGIITCHIHGDFKQTPNSHLNGQKCPQCGIIDKSNLFKKTIYNFIIDAKLVHGDRYDYSLVNYVNNHIKIKIICPTHGEFEQAPNCHLNGSGCPKCTESKGERDVRLFLEQNNIEYVIEKTFDRCKYKTKLQFDFYLPNENILIEYDGIQHFKSIKHFGGEDELLVRQRRDLIKTNYAKAHNIKLIRISYLENVEERLINTLGIVI